MKPIISFRPPRLALVYLMIAAILHYFSPAGTVLHIHYRLLSTLLCLAGFGIMMWAWLLFQQKKTAVCLPGRSTAMIHKGPYRFTRNPMYLGMLCMLCGAGFMLGSIVAFLAPVAFYITMNEIFIPFEELKMTSAFPQEYTVYKESVRRWL